MTVRKIILYIVLFLIIPTISWAKSIRQHQIFFPDFGGLNTTISPLVLEPKSLITATNVLYDQVGTRQKRGGITKISSASLGESSGVYGIFDFRKIATNGAETRKLIAYHNNHIYKMDALDTQWDDITSSELSSTKPIDYAVLRKATTTVDTVIMVNGENTPQVWDQDSATVSDLTGTPDGVDFYPSMIEAHKNRLWAAGVPSYPYRVFFSAINKHDDWNTAEDAGYIDVIDSWGSKITGLVSYFGYLIVFTENSVHRISGSSYDDFAVTPLIQNIGSVNNSGILAVGNDLFFVSSKGIHSLSTTQEYGDVKSAYISAPIQTDFNGLDFSEIDKCAAAVYSPLNYAIWSFTSSGENYNDVCYVYDYIGKRWSKWTGINAASLATIQDANNKETLVAGDYNGYINKLNQTTYDDNGVVYTMDWATPLIYFGDPMIDKHFRSIIVYLQTQDDPSTTGDMKLYYRITNQPSDTIQFSQFAGSGSTYDEFVMDADILGAATLISQTFNITGHGKTLQLEFIHETSGSGSQIFGYGVEYEAEDMDYSH